MKPPNRFHVSLLIAIALLALGFRWSAGGSIFLHFQSPGFEQLSLPGELPWELNALLLRPTGPAQLELVDAEGNASTVPEGAFEVRHGILRRAAGTAAVPEAGRYQLNAEVQVRFFFFRFTLMASAPFEIVDLAHPDECEILNNAECLLPYPSSRFEVETAGGVSMTDWMRPSPRWKRSPGRGHAARERDGVGKEVLRDHPRATRGIDRDRSQLDIAFPQVGIPEVVGTQIPASLVSGIDGFSPTVQIFVHFPGGVDLEASDAAVLLDRGSSPPWIETRTHDARSLERHSPTVLLDLDTGERVPHWVEMDSRAEGNPGRQAFILRPAVSLVPSHHYAVAIRNLVHPDGSAVMPEPVFRTLRDGRKSDIPALNERRHPMERLFRRLHRAGVPRKDLLIAFDFHVQSEHSLTHQMLTMRDLAFEWLDEQVDADVQTFTVTEVEDFPDCEATENVHRRIVLGTFQSPLFLTEAPSPTNVAQLNVDENDNPVQNGTMDAAFTISIPCLIEREDAPELYTILLGHGIFGRGEDLVRGIPEGAAENLGQFDDTREWNYIAGATDWSGWSAPDFLWAGRLIVGFGASQLHNFPAFPDRHRQGQTNTLILSRMMKRAIFNRDEAFQLEGVGAFPGPETTRKTFTWFRVPPG